MMSMDSTKSFERPCWYAIQTRPQEEGRAEMNLMAWGVATLAPKIKESRHNQFTGKPTHFTKPLFPRYIFARFDAETLQHKVSYTRGVQSVVSFNNRPLEVDDEAIALIRSRMDEDGFVRLENEPKPGDEVMINNGSLKGLNGIFDKRIKGTDRVRIFLQTVSYQAHVTINKSLVQQSGSLFSAAA
jgi:transcriptional antiterminator RfaH